MKSKISIVAIKQMGERRADGFVEEIMSHGTIVGEFLEIDQVCYGNVMGKYRPKPMRGLGDAVAVVAQPIARTIDRVVGTHIEGCGGCKKRQEKLNKLVPFNK